MAEVATLGLKVEGAENIDRAKESLVGFTGAAAGAEKATEGVTKSTTAAGKSVGGLGASASTTTPKLQSLAKVGGLLAAAFSIGAIRRYADSWSDMQSQVGAATGDMAGSGAAMRRLTDIANASYSSIEQTVAGYARNSSTLLAMGKSASEAADYTESLNHMLVLTATRGERAASVQNALSKAMAVGKLEADGLESVLTNGGEVAKALADELDTDVLSLRKFASEGRITGQVIANAVIKPLDDVRDRAAEMPATLGDAFTRVNNNLTEFVGRIDKATGASSAIADVILSFADGIRKAGDYIIHFGTLLAPVFSMVSEYAGIAVAAIAGFYAPALIAGLFTTTGAIGVGLVGAIKAVGVAMMANPIGLIVSVLVAAAVAAYQFSGDFRKFIGEDLPAFAISAGNKIIGTFVGAYELLKSYWSNFPTFFGAAVIGAVNLYIGGINSLVSGAVSGLNTVIELANKIPGVDIGTVDAGAGQIGLLDNPYADAAMAAANSAVEAAKAAFNKDWLAGAFEAFSLPIYGDTPLTGTGGTGGGGGRGGGSGKENANKKLIDDLAQSLYLAGLQGDALALAQARLKLDQYATPDQIAQVESLTLAIERAKEAAANRGKFGENAKEAESYILGDTDPLSGGAFDDQFARYAAEAVAEEERYALQQERLAMARELQIETNRSYDELEEEAARVHAARMGQIDQAKAQTMLSTAQGAFGAVADVMRNAAGEQSGIYRAMFAVSKAFAIGEATLNAYNAISAAWASAPFPANLAAVAATAPQVMAVISAVTSTGLTGMAHDGIDSVPREGTWLLDKGERVMTQNTSARLDSVLDRIDTRTRGTGAAASQAPIVNVIEDASKAGRTEVTRDASGQYSTSVFVANIRGGGIEAETLESVYGLQRIGR